MNIQDMITEIESAVESTLTSENERLDNYLAACENAIYELEHEYALESDSEVDDSNVVTDIRTANKEGNVDKLSDASGDLKNEITEAEKEKDPNKKKKMIKRILIGAGALAAIAGGTALGLKIRKEVKAGNITGIKSALAMFGSWVKRVGRKNKKEDATVAEIIRGDVVDENSGKTVLKAEDQESKSGPKALGGGGRNLALPAGRSDEEKAADEKAKGEVDTKRFQNFLKNFGFEKKDKEINRLRTIMVEDFDETAESTPIPELEKKLAEARKHYEVANKLAKEIGYDPQTKTYRGISFFANLKKFKIDKSTPNYRDAEIYADKVAKNARDWLYFVNSFEKEIEKVNDPKNTRYRQNEDK